MPIQVEQVEPLAALIGEHLDPLIELVDPREPHRPGRHRIIIDNIKRKPRSIVIVIVIEILRLLLSAAQRPLNSPQTHAHHLGYLPEAVALDAQPGDLPVPVIVHKPSV